jgi:hypothetical protein
VYASESNSAVGVPASWAAAGNATISAIKNVAVKIGLVIGLINLSGDEIIVFCAGSFQFAWPACQLNFVSMFRTPEQIIGHSREREILLSQGMKTGEACRRIKPLEIVRDAERKS